MNYDDIAKYCYDHRPVGALFAADDYWIRTIMIASEMTLLEAGQVFSKLVEYNIFHKLNNKNYILNYKYFRKYENIPRPAQVHYRQR